MLLPRVQITLLERLLHRDLSNPMHQTNVHLHYEVPTPAQCPSLEAEVSTSYFSADPKTSIQPKDPNLHKSMTLKQMLESKLRWVTLGGQYDWTNKVYPDELPPPFPPDIAAFLKGLFPAVDSQAAIDRGLISASIGCDAIFIIGNEDGSRTSTIRLRSGDVVLMSGESRYAWHAVPRIVAGTCPRWLQDWPASSSTQAHQPWKGWMGNKRINLNVRQMHDR
jgi:alkylated DNA repair dioxygenase AlkB